MSLVFDIGKGAGLAGATGVRPFLPPLLAGALAREDAGIDFSGTAYRFLESPGFLLAVFVVAALAYALERRRVEHGAPPSDSSNRVELALGLLGAGLGALLFAGSLADDGYQAWPGLIAGAAVAVLGFASVALLLRRARRRLPVGQGSFIAVYGDLIALGLAGLSILFPPVGFAAIVAFLVLLARTRGSGDKKYEGLRVLR
ncbi:MAG: hypothetical protein QOE08_236 [Thermoleophilaceae bacterium]|nr:hypothetical protein [Thermoleophilaceae bacterium]